ncbi:hypothetical protein TWF694_003201 [Orbilia ellipsospora]|uniref:Protein kinase domain-containing protein n=1 Tax=Orbilia ellipsospora TaxID=2528407 RepID=A0AAV9X174_9PEZI
MATAGMVEHSLRLGWRIDDCQSYQYLAKILDVEQPKFKTPSEKLQNLDKLFYPLSDVKEVFMRDGVLRNIVGCTRCGGCRSFVVPGMVGNLLEEDSVIKSVMDPQRPRFILLAILLCMGQTYLIRHLNGDRFSDITLDNISNGMVLPRANLQRLLPQSLSVEDFLDRFQMLRRRFDLKTFDQFSKGRRLEFDEEDILPFHKDEPYSSSSYGIVRKFEIYDCYNNIYHNDRKVTQFARKILKAEITEEDFKYERDNLAFVNSLNNPNIIGVFCWYTRKKQGNKKEFTYVFPFMEASLQDVLTGKPNTPEHLRNHQAASLYSSPMWQKTVDVASGLVAIHNPDAQALEQQGLQPEPGGWFGYHFDIKPSNILIDSDGKFVITDFGLSVFKRRGTENNNMNLTRTDESEVLYGQPGTPAYQPPGIPRAPGILLPGEFQNDVPKMRRTYDVWSLACVMTEVITFVIGYNGYIGPEAVALFKNKRAADSTVDGSTAWHYRSSAHDNECRLKPSVEDWFNYMRRVAGGDDPYLANILELLLVMFKIHNRCNSKEVKQKLNDANQREKERQAVLLGTVAPPEETPFSVNQWIRSRGTENLIYTSDIQAKFMIFVQDYYYERASIDSRSEQYLLGHSPDVRNEPAGKMKLRPWIEVETLKIFQSDHRRSRLRVVMTFKEQNRLVAESEGSEWSYEQFIPLYRYEDLDPDFANTCAFRNTFVDRLIGFEDPEDLRHFQETILSYRLKTDSDQNISFCFTNGESSTWKASIDGARVEIWTTHGLNKPLPLYNGGQNGRGLPTLSRIISGNGVSRSPSSREGSILSAATDGKRHDSTVVIFRPSHRDILMIPVLQQKARLCSGHPGAWGDPLSISFVNNPPHDKFAILKLRSANQAEYMDHMDPIGSIPGLPLELHDKLMRSRDDVDNRTVFNHTCVSLKFKSDLHRRDFIISFYRAFPFKPLFEKGFYNSLVKAEIISART